MALIMISEKANQPHSLTVKKLEKKEKLRIN